MVSFLGFIIDCGYASGCESVRGNEEQVVSEETTCLGKISGLFWFKEEIQLEER